MKRVHKILASLLALGIAAGCAYVDTRQGEWIFRPVQGQWSGYRNQAAHFEEHWIPVGTEGEKLHAWYSPAADPDTPALLYLHGARWNLSGSVTRIPRWNRMGFSVLAIDYRGFGESSAHSPTEQSANEDAEAAWAYLQKLAPARKHFIFGHSLGGAMAAQLAVRHPEASGLILEATFTNIPELIKEYPLGFLPVGMLVRQRFDNLECIPAVKIPVLFAHGTNDSTVPFKMSERLFAAATAPKRFFRAEGGTHHNLSANYFEEYRRTVDEFFGLAVTDKGSSHAIAGS
ncbi:MAG TPA: alpha/beta fold hydrolase [Usitatibacteraceae bacterium]